MKQPSAGRAAARLAGNTLRAWWTGEALPALRVHRQAAEANRICVDAARLRRYLAATRATGVALFQGAGAVLPPCFSTTWEAALSLELLGRLGLPLPAGGIVHLYSERVPLRPLRAAEPIRCRVEVDRVVRGESGTRLFVAASSWNAAGHLCSRGTSGFVLRHSRRSGRTPAAAAPPAGAGQAPPAAGAAEPPVLWRELAHWALAADLGRRYARASGDYNPVHLWGWTARPLGFCRPILHGYCTEALVAHALIEHLWNGDALALRRLETYFRLPVELPSRVRLLVGECPGRHRFRVVDAADAERVCAEGVFAGG